MILSPNNGIGLALNSLENLLSLLIFLFQRFNSSMDLKDMAILRINRKKITTYSSKPRLYIHFENFNIYQQA